ncbi:MAG: ROK family transcriptional regulator [Deltaproteobacteria bacterium]|nr:ROK family transcriptional regulator [Deltaproteobacteria bacterium]
MSSRADLLDTEAPSAPFSDGILGAAQVRAQHSGLLLRLLWQAREVSRADLSRSTGLSRSTISAIVADLLDTGLVHEARPGESRGGRKPILLAFNDDAYYLVGVDMGATHVSVVVTNLRAVTRSWATQSIAVRNQPEASLALITRLVDESLARLGADASQVLGIGVSVPSPVDPDRPGRLLPLILPKWRDYDIIEHLGARYDAPVFMDNDANVGALAEVWWGGRREGVDLAFIKVAMGIGAGFVIKGRIHRGRHGTAGEMGHTALDPNGPRCVCGLTGCLNTLVGSDALLARAKAGLVDAPNSLLKGRLTVDKLVDAALAGDPTAQEVIGFAGRTLGVGVANLLNLLAPDVVVLGGGLTRAGALLMKPLEETVSNMSLANAVGRTQIEVSQLGERGVALGAATMALEAALDDHTLFHSRGLATV